MTPRCKHPDVLVFRQIATEAVHHFEDGVWKGKTGGEFTATGRHRIVCEDCGLDYVVYDVGKVPQWLQPLIDEVRNNS